MEVKSLFNQVVCSMVPCKGPLSGQMYVVEVLRLPKLTRGDQDWFLTPVPTMALPHGGGGGALCHFSVQWSQHTR